MTQRITRLVNSINKNNIDAFLITNPANIYYISGFKSDSSSLLITKGENFLITDFRYKEDAGEIDNFKIELIEESYRDTLSKLLKGSGARRVGFEADHTSYTRACMLTDILKSGRRKLCPLSGIIEELRSIKDEREIQQIRGAIAIAKKALAALKVKPGMTERKIAQELDNLVRVFGADKGGFETIIASGNNSSRPHAAITDRAVASNDLVLIDFGASLDMYNCDLTRVVILGKIQSLLYDIYNICKEAQKRAIRIIKPGVKIKDIDRAARDHIASRGFKDCFGHSLGHGVGLSVHELPRMYSKNNKVLRPGMVFTVEPGIYIEGSYGVRLEDMVLVTKNGCEVLTDDIPK